MPDSAPERELTALPHADFHSYDPQAGHGLPHDPLKAIIAPRPIGWIASCDAGGQRNLAPYSFFNMVSSAPPILMFSSEGRKHTVTNIAQTGAFVFNLATRPLAKAMNISSGNFAKGIDEFDQAGLEALGSDRVDIPRVATAAAAMECRLIEIKHLHDMDGNPIDNHMVLGQVVRVHINKAYLIDGMFDITRAQTIARCGYRGDYVETTQTFDMRRPVIKG